MPASTTPIVRNSLTDSLLKRYESSPSIANVGGGSAKDVGTDRAAVNAVDQSNQYSKQFQIKNGAGFTSAAENYSSNVLKVPTTKYAPGGRLP